MHNYRAGLSMKFPVLAAVLAIGFGGAESFAQSQAGASGTETAAIEATQVQSPLGVAIVDKLSRKKASDPVRAFYEARGGAPLWITEAGRGTAAAEALLAALWTVDSHGLPVARYRPDELTASLNEGTADLTALAARELDFTATYLRYGRDIASGVLQPRKVDRELYVYPERPDPAGLLTAMAGAENPGQMLAGLAPQDPKYGRLRELLVTYRAIVKQGGWGAVVAKGKTMRPGDRAARVETLRARLAALGDLDIAGAAADGNASLAAETELASVNVVSDVPQASVRADPRMFDAELVRAVERFQARHGLFQDGLVGPATRSAINTSAEKRLQQIVVGLERLRWLNKDLGERHILVNIAGFEMALMERDEPIFTSRVVVGTRKHQTPEFSDQMEHMVVNPTWNVPKSIAVDVILPKLQEDPSYLARNNMNLLGADASQIDWSTVTPATFPGRVTQSPGGGNALGKVKFMFPNDHAIYLHDSPAKNLFTRETRAYSRGCVRVQQPFDFAEKLLAPQEADPANAFSKWVQRGSERYVKLAEPVPVHLTYRTAWIDDAGVTQFRSDVYGRDRKVARALEAAGVNILGN